jgi:hypothetical protein
VQRRKGGIKWAKGNKFVRRGGPFGGSEDREVGRVLVRVGVFLVGGGAGEDREVGRVSAKVGKVSARVGVLLVGGGGIREVGKGGAGRMGFVSGVYGGGRGRRRSNYRLVIRLHGERRGDG